VRSHELVPASTWLLVELPVFVVAVVIALVVPLALAAAAVPSPMRRAGWIAGLAAAVGLVAIRSPGVFAVLPCVPFAGVAVAAGLLGLARLVAHPRTAARLALAVGLVFVPAAATWLLAYQVGHPLLGYSPFWVLLTAAHFGVAGVALPVVAARVAHERGVPASAIAIGYIVAVPLTAAGIHGPAILEVVGALATAIAGVGIGVLLLTARDAAARPWSVLAGVRAR
jgi:hypothetical protein